MKKKILIIIAVLVVLIASAFYWQNKYQIFDRLSNTVKEPEKFATINGNLIEDKSLAERRPLAIVVENHPDARPQSGLEDAEIVYETLAEGGITRFLAVFQSRQPKEIGPIRSARPYFAFLANMWHAGFFHSGGSKQALADLSKGVYGNLYYVNEFSNGKSFTRNPARSAPHNLYSTVEKLSELLKDKNENNWTPMQMWEFEVIPTDQIKTEVTNITLPFSTPSFTAKYLFDPTTGTYKRSIGTGPHLDKTSGQQISPKNILVQLVTVTPVPGDELLTVEVNLKNGGPCYLFTGGVLKKCTWTFEEGKTIYKNELGEPLKLQPGQTWVELFPRDKQSNIEWN